MPRAKGFGSSSGRVKKLSSEDSKYVGRPGFKGRIPGPTDGKDSVRRVRQIDPARGITQPGADVITTTHVDLVGNRSAGIVGGKVNTQFPSGKKTVKRAGSSLKKR